MSEEEKTPDTRPNIVFLFSDQQRFDTVSCYGVPPGAAFGLTPNIDRLAAEGVRFDLAMTCQPVCGPARACLQTGLYPDGIGCSVNDRALPPGIPEESMPKVSSRLPPFSAARWA